MTHEQGEPVGILWHTLNSRNITTAKIALTGVELPEDATDSMKEKLVRIADYIHYIDAQLKLTFEYTEAVRLSLELAKELFNKKKEKENGNG